MKGSTPVEIPSSSLARAINKTIFAVSTDELRPAMTGILVQLVDNQVTFVATDGHRLLRYRRSDVGAGQTANIIIPRKALQPAQGRFALRGHAGAGGVQQRQRLFQLQPDAAGVPPD